MTGKGAKGDKAKKAATSLKKGSGRKSTRVHTKVHFYKPNTLKLARQPKVLTKSSVPAKADTKYDIIKFPLTTESAMKKVEDDNTLVFIVNITANKRQIKNAMKSLYDVDVQKVNTLIRPDGQKKAYVRLTADQDATDLANQLGMI
mmetsp:Transcript_10017/g.26598  ORF Transcript_10017/g.26598 Transcript_10017/m.26598 type:complete len:146 (-) Transcript_10017:41-478(-)|eukprot:CAMPEP_0117458458 /NCGR_PEP_ID=MMETSP0784-20121206/944_1 /TAXON_ID=39447 /ORGANISM="" /LENGTH=145 /DNA_ID=CAMNT_0005251983 /DNA_START=19 /DNA_END=456 /DNA_ORIENTATION=-